MKKEKYVYVEYKGHSGLWIYKINGEFKVGDVVEAPTYNYSIINVAIIREIKRLTRYDLPVEYERILTITKKLDSRDYEKYFFPIRYMKKHINKFLIKEWRLDYKNNWVEVYCSKFGGCISYEKDGVLTGSIGSYTNNNYYEEYTLTDRRKFKIKLYYFQTILSELYHKKINESEFVGLLRVI